MSRKSKACGEESIAWGWVYYDQWVIGVSVWQRNIGRTSSDFEGIKNIGIPAKCKVITVQSVCTKIEQPNKP